MKFRDTYEGMLIQNIAGRKARIVLKRDMVELIDIEWLDTRETEERIKPSEFDPAKKQHARQ